MHLARSSLASCEIVCQPARIFAFGLVDGSSTHPSFRDFALSNRVSHNLVQWGESQKNQFLHNISTWSAKTLPPYLRVHQVTSTKGIEGNVSY